MSVRSDLEGQRTYGVRVGRLWVQIDFEAQAVSIDIDNGGDSARTEDVAGAEGMLLIDRDAHGDVVSVEVLG